MQPLSDVSFLRMSRLIGPNSNRFSDSRIDPPGTPVGRNTGASSETLGVGRFAPSTTGPAHPGTLLAGLLCWLDARAGGARVVLRLEDLDPERCRPELALAMQEALGWLGLEWDAVHRQSELAAAHEAALDRLADAGLLYPCRCSRREIRGHARRAPDGSWRYPGTCRPRPLPGVGEGGWRAATDALRVRLPEGGSGHVELMDESGQDLSGHPAVDYGDPVVRRRDAAIAYHLASVVDDHESGVTRVVRGRDLAPSTAVQVVLQRLLGLPTPAYRHHLLLLEHHGGKLAKLHGAVGWDLLRAHYEPAALCGVLARAAGLRDSQAPVTPGELLADFGWEGVATTDRLLEWDGERLEVGDSATLEVTAGA
jgi:glutamyl/glutaminyl-tRNA synthetase